MSLLFSLLMKMDAGQAKAELRNLQGELAKGKGEVAALGKAAVVADGQIDQLGAASGRAAAQNDRLAQSGKRVAASNGQAAASMGNLVANFNDIGMMLAAGQNPLQMAIQQGTQITQVIGPMGASGAARALGGAFVSMLSPLNLATLGIIAFGGLAVQWLMGAAGSTKSATDAVGDLENAVSSLQKVAATDLAALRKDFGTITPEILSLTEALGRVETVKAFRVQAEALAALRAETEGSWFAAFNEDRWSQADQIASLLGTKAADPMGTGTFPAEIREFRTAIESLESAKGPRAQLEVFVAMREQMELATGGINQMTVAQLEFYDNIAKSEAALRQMVQAETEMLRVQQESRRSSSDNNDRMGGPTWVDLAKPEANTSDDLAKANELRSALQEQASIQALINQYGKDSAVVTLARVEAERAAFAEMVAGLDVTTALKDEMMATWDAANGVASARIASMIQSALGPASALNGLLKSAAGWWSSLKSNMAIANFNRDAKAGSMQYSGRGGDPRDFLPGGNRDTSGRFVYDGPSLDIHNNPIGSGTGAGRGGGGARAEKDAVAELIAKLREEQEVLRETDPVAREMLKYRTQLADASKAQRKEVENLIRAEIELKAVQQAREYFSNAAGDFIDQIIAKGGKAIDVLRNMAAQFLSMAARSVLTGQGWFANLLGISTPLFGGTKAATAAGVSGRSTAAYQPAMVRMSNAGMATAASAGSSSAKTAVQPVINVTVMGATGNTEIQEMTEKGIRAGLDQFNRHVLPERVLQISARPRNR